MVRGTSDGTVKIKITLDGRVHEKIEKLAKDSGLSVPKFIAECIEGLALDPILRLLHDDPALAREVAVKALGDYLDGVQVSGHDLILEAPMESDPEPEPELEPVDPNAEAKELFSQIMNSLAPIAEKLGMTDGVGGGNGKSPEPQSSEPPRKAMGRQRKSRPAPPRRG